MKRNQSTRPPGQSDGGDANQTAGAGPRAISACDLSYAVTIFRVLAHARSKAMRMLCGLCAAALICIAADPNQLYRDAIAAYDQGRFADAERLHLEALPYYQAMLPPDHELVITSLHNLGVLARRRGDYSAAAKWLNAALAVAPAGSLLRADSLNGLATVLEHRKRPLEAEPLVREAISILEALPQPDHLELADSLNTLGLLHLALGDPEGAERQFTRARDRLNFAATVPPEFRSTLAVNLAAAVFRQNKTVDALRLYGQALQEAEHSFGMTDPRTGAVRHYYAEALRKTGRRADAKALIRAHTAP